MYIDKQVLLLNKQSKMLDPSIQEVTDTVNLFHS